MHFQRIVYFVDLGYMENCQKFAWNWTKNHGDWGSFCKWNV